MNRAKARFIFLLARSMVSKAFFVSARTMDKSKLLSPYSLVKVGRCVWSK